MQLFSSFSALILQFFARFTHANIQLFANSHPIYCNFLPTKLMEWLIYSIIVERQKRQEHKHPFSVPFYTCFWASSVPNVGKLLTHLGQARCPKWAQSVSVFYTKRPLSLDRILVLLKRGSVCGWKDKHETVIMPDLCNYPQSAIRTFTLFFITAHCCQSGTNRHRHPVARQLYHTLWTRNRR